MIDPISSIAPVTPGSPVAANAILKSASAPSPDMQGLTDAFNRMMAREPDPTIYSEQHLSRQESPASAFVAQQEKIMYHTFDEVRKFSMEAPGMSMQDMAARHIDLSYQVAMVSVQYNAGVYMAQSSKSGLQTLMRNQ